MRRRPGQADPSRLMLSDVATVRTKLTSVGDELALVLDPETLDALCYAEGTEVELRVEGDRLVIEPVPGPPPEREPSP